MSPDPLSLSLSVSFAANLARDREGKEEARAEREKGGGGVRVTLSVTLIREARERGDDGRRERGGMIAGDTEGGWFVSSLEMRYSTSAAHHNGLQEREQ